jgi:beta-xylosidase
MFHGMRKMRPLGICLGVFVAVLGVLTACATAATAPSYTGNLPDPSVVLSGTTYYAFGTQDGDGSQSNIQRIASASLTGGWIPTASDPQTAREALPTLPSWASPGATWAPALLHVGSQWLMYYTVHDAATNQQCVSVATAATPAQTFKDTSSGPLVCINGSSIDPAAFLDPASNTLYLFWRSTYRTLFGSVPAIWGQRLASTGMSMASGTSPVRLLSRDRSWEGGTIEGPAMVRSPNGRYDLFYSANDWTTANYAVGYAECTSPLSGCTKKSTTGPWFGAHQAGGPQGPGGESFLTDTSNQLQMAYHAWGQSVGYAAGGKRMLWISPLSFTGTGQPIAPTP